jgi:uncharacterized protein (TIGR00266 family)
MQTKDTNLIKASKEFNGPAVTKDFEFQILGDNSAPVLELTLKPNKTFIAESGSMMTMMSTIKMDSIFGDGTNEGGLLSKAWKGLKRSVSGENLFMTTFNNTSKNLEQKLTIAAPFPGEIMAINLAENDNELICQRGAFLTAPMGVDIDVHLKKKVGYSLFGGEGFVMQKISGDDWVFLNAGGNMYVHELQEGERLIVDTGCVVAQTKDIGMNVKSLGVKNFLFGGEGLFVAELEGPGKVWTQSMPFSRFVSVVANAIPSKSSSGSGTVGDFARDMLDPN